MKAAKSKWDEWKLRKTNQENLKKLHTKSKIENEELVTRNILERAKPISTHMGPTFLLVDDDNLMCNNTIVRQAISSLLYFAITRPDFSAAVKVLSRINDAPRGNNWYVAKKYI